MVKPPCLNPFITPTPAAARCVLRCFSSLGRIGERQLISLQKWGCVQHGIVQHEVMHALGFFHEHTRSDRDKHILIHWEQIKDCECLPFAYVVPVPECGSR